MKTCIIADFEWCVTPHPVNGGERFVYFNEILSAGAVRVDESGSVTDRLYRLIRPVNADYLHPVVLTSLRLDRGELAGAQEFSRFFEEFRAFIDDTPVFAWGCADQSALTQNVRIKGSPEQKLKCPPGTPALQMRDLQPTLCRGLQIHSPYPSLAAVLSRIGLKNEENRHNSLSDAEDTAQIVRTLVRNVPASVSVLFSGGSRVSKEIVTESPETPENGITFPEGVYRSVGECLRTARKQRRLCPVCGDPIGIGTWIRCGQSSLCTLCCCMKDGKFLCTVEAVPGTNDKSGYYTVKTANEPFEGEVRTRYAAARRAVRKN